MTRFALLTLCLLFATGCAMFEGEEHDSDMSTDMSMGMEQPDPPAEMAKLERMVGKWSGTAEMVSGAPEGAPDSFKGESRMHFVHNGFYLMSEGWHEMGPGMKAHYTEIWAWDPGAGKYRTFWFSDMGEWGTGWATASADGSEFQIKADAMDAAGNKKSGTGTGRFVDDDTMEWTWTERGPMGEMTMKGTSHRK
jgi:hypothetical protein